MTSLQRNEGGGVTVKGYGSALMKDDLSSFVSINPDCAAVCSGDWLAGWTAADCVVGNEIDVFG